MIAPAADQSHARQAFDNWCCRRDPHDPHSAVRPNGRALLTPALPFEAPLSEASLARISGPGARRVGKFTVVVSTVWPPQIRADDALTYSSQRRRSHASHRYSWHSLPPSPGTAFPHRGQVMQFLSAPINARTFWFVQQGGKGRILLRSAPPTCPGSARPPAPNAGASSFGEFMTSD